jgi:ClpP class serine protease
MSWDERVELYQKIEAHRKRPLIVYVTSKRLGASAMMSSDALPQIIEHLDALPEGSKALDFLIVSYGGDPMVAWRLMTLIRERVDNVAVLIPQSAYSAATLVVFGADDIVMHPNGHLGPVDMQITSAGSTGQAKTFSTEDISAFLDFVRESCETILANPRMVFSQT